MKKRLFAAVTVMATMIGVTAASAITIIDPSASSFERISPDPMTFVEGTDFHYFVGSGEGDVTGTLSQPSLATGCSSTDFSSFVSGSIALIERGTCLFSVKTQNALDAGAVAVLIYNDGISSGREGPLNGTLQSDFSIPVLGPSFALGELLKQQSGATFRIVTVAEVTPVPIPASLPLFAAGLGGLGLMARRKRKAA